MARTAETVFAVVYIKPILGSTARTRHYKIAADPQPEAVLPSRVAQRAGCYSTVVVGLFGLPLEEGERNAQLRECSGHGYFSSDYFPNDSTDSETIPGLVNSR